MIFVSIAACLSKTYRSSRRKLNPPLLSYSECLIISLVLRPFQRFSWTLKSHWNYHKTKIPKLRLFYLEVFRISKLRTPVCIHQKVLKFFRLALNSIFAFGKRRKGRHHDAGIKPEQNIFQPLEIRILSFDFPSNSDCPIFISAYCFNCVQILISFPEFIDKRGVFLEFLKTSIREKLLCDGNLHIFVMV